MVGIRGIEAIRDRAHWLLSARQGRECGEEPRRLSLALAEFASGLVCPLTPLSPRGCCGIGQYSRGEIRIAVRKPILGVK